MLFTKNDQVYSSLPDDINPETSFAERQQVLKILKDNRNVRMTTAKELTNILGFKKSEGSVKVRKLITELLVFNHVPIIATSRGYKLTRDRNELMNYHDNLNARIMGLNKRIRVIKKMSEDESESAKKWFLN